MRVQNSHISDPTAREAIDNMMIEQAIREGDLTEVIAELDEDIRRIHEMEITYFSLFSVLGDIICPSDEEHLKPYRSFFHTTHLPAAP